MNDPETPHFPGYDFLAIWRMPDRESAVPFGNMAEDSGLHDFGEQVNARGKIASVEQVGSTLLNP